MHNINWLAGPADPPPPPLEGQNPILSHQERRLSRLTPYAPPLVHVFVFPNILVNGSNNSVGVEGRVVEGQEDVWWWGEGGVFRRA